MSAQWYIFILLSSCWVISPAQIGHSHGKVETSMSGNLTPFDAQLTFLWVSSNALIITTIYSRLEAPEYLTEMCCLYSYSQLQN